MSGSDPVPTWSVAELHEAVGLVLVHAFGDEVWVEGELRNSKRSANGHVYFDLVDPGRDGDATRPMLAVTLFDRERQTVNRHLIEQGGAVKMGDGVRIRIQGRLNIYGPRSTLQLRMSWIDPAYTLGVLGQERDRVLALLAAEQLLETNAALALPVVPMHIGLVTSVGSAAHADALDELRRAELGFRVSVFDARTQGVDAASSITTAVAGACRAGVDVVLVVRGGGARTDLAAFDSEAVGRAIATATAPVFTGIGHEIDRTVADDVAHSAHKTPTAAAAAIVTTAAAFRTQLHDLGAQVDSAARGRLTRAGGSLEELSRRAGRCAVHQIAQDHQRIDHLQHRVALSAPRTLDRVEAAMGELARRLPAGPRRDLARASDLLETLAARSRAHDPAITLARGWTITRRADGELVRAAEALLPGERIVTTTGAGTVISVVDDADTAEDRT